MSSLTCGLRNDLQFFHSINQFRKIPFLCHIMHHSRVAKVMRTPVVVVVAAVMLLLL